RGPVAQATGGPRRLGPARPGAGPVGAHRDTASPCLAGAHQQGARPGLAGRRGPRVTRTPGPPRARQASEEAMNARFHVVLCLTLLGGGAGEARLEAAAPSLPNPWPEGARVIRLARVYRNQLTHRGSASALAFSPDGRWLAVADVERSVHLYDTALFQ